MTFIDESLINFEKLKELVEKWIDMDAVNRGEYLVNPEFN